MGLYLAAPSAVIDPDLFLQVGVDWVCNPADFPINPGACVAKTAKAQTAYIALQNALNQKLFALGRPGVPLTGSIDQATKEAVKSLLGDTAKLPLSNLQITPGKFVVALAAATSAPSSSGMWWKIAAGVAATGAVGFLLFRR